MKFDIVTIFPRMFDGPTREGILGRAIERGLVDLRVVDLRDFTDDRHRTVDDVAYGGGPGMVLKPAPLFRAVEHLRETRGEPAAVILTSPQGKPFCQADAVRLSRLGHVVVLCGRYEGVDERVRDHVATEETVDRRLRADRRGTAGARRCSTPSRGCCRGRSATSSRSSAIRSRAGCSTTRTTRGRPSSAASPVPDVLLSGHHEQVRRWRQRQAVERTLARRPDLLAAAELDDEERAIVRELIAGTTGGDRRCGRLKRLRRRS